MCDFVGTVPFISIIEYEEDKLVIEISGRVGSLDLCQGAQESGVTYRNFPIRIQLAHNLQYSVQCFYTVFLLHFIAAKQGRNPSRKSLTLPHLQIVFPSVSGQKHYCSHLSPVRPVTECAQVSLPVISTLAHVLHSIDWNMPIKVSAIFSF